MTIHLEDLLAAPVSLSLNQARDQHRNFWKLIAPGAPLVEVRAIDKKGNGNYHAPGSGFADNEETFLSYAEQFAKPKNIIASAGYATFNELKPELQALACNQWNPGAKVTTNDPDVTRRRFVLIDIDPDRKSGISTTPAEREISLRTAHAIASFLGDTLGFPEPALIGSSGNGAFILYRIDLPNDDAATDLVKRCLKALKDLFATPQVEIDQVVSNPARIMKIPGTIAAKGDPFQDRTYRFSYGFFNHETGVVSVDQLESLAAMAQSNSEEPKKSDSKSKTKTEEPRTESTAGSATDATDTQAKSLQRLTTALTERGFGHEIKSRDTRKIVPLTDRCLTSDAHTTGAAFTVFENGALSYSCQHNTCSGKGWNDVREQLGYGRGPTSQQQTSREDRSFIPRSELRNRPGASYLIPDFVSGDGLTVASGPSGAGKTFAALAFAKAIADGGRVFDRQAKQGAVAYIAGEGDFDINERLSALEIHTGKPTADEFFSVLDYGPNLIAEVDDVIAKVKALPVAPVLLILDTLHTTFTGEENSAKDMGAYLRAIAKIREETGASLLVIHHHGKNGTIRGSSALVAAANTHLEIESTAHDGVILKCGKQKSRRAFDPIRLKKTPVMLGEPTSILDVPIGDVTTLSSFVFEVDKEPVKNGGLPEIDREALQVLADAGDWISVREWESLTEIPRTSMQRVRDRLKVGGLIETQQSGKTLRNRITDAGRLALDPQPKARVSRNPFARKDEAA